MRGVTDSEMCLLRAADYEETARQVSLAPDREALLKMAEYWRGRAAEAERASWAPRSPPAPNRA